MATLKVTGAALLELELLRDDPHAYHSVTAVSLVRPRSFPVDDPPLIAAVLTSLATLPTLVVLDLSGSMMGSAFAASLAEALATNSTLASLILNASGLGDDGCLALGRLLSCGCTQLSCLGLAQNEIGGRGLRALSLGLSIQAERGHGVAQLDLSDNAFEDDIGALCQALIGNAVLRSLHLRGNRLTGIGLKHMLAGLKENAAVRVLDLSRNDFSATDAESVKHLLELNCAVDSLSLQFNDFGLDGVALIEDGLAVNAAVRHLTLEGENTLRAALLWRNGRTSTVAALLVCGRRIARARLPPELWHLVFFDMLPNLCPHAPLSDDFEDDEQAVDHPDEAAIGDIDDVHDEDNPNEMDGAADADWDADELDTFDF